MAMKRETLTQKVGVITFFSKKTETESWGLAINEWRPKNPFFASKNNIKSKNDNTICPAPKNRNTKNIIIL